MEKEKNTETKLVRAVKLMGGMAPKFVSPGLDGVPDRLVLLPGAKFAFAEIKTDGKTMRPLQVKRKRQLEALGFSVYCIDKPEQIGAVLDEIQSSCITVSSMLSEYTIRRWMKLKNCSKCRDRLMEV